MMRRRCYSLPVAVVCLLLSACSSDGKRWNPDDYTAKSGDTLYSIAWRYELDPEEFAAWNGISSSTFIKAGQRLHTRKPADYRPYRRDEDAERDSKIAYAPGSQQAIPAGAKWVRAQRGDTLYSLSKRSGVSVKELALLNQLDEPYTIQPGQTIFLKPLNKSDKVSVNKATPPSAPVAAAPAAKPIKWPARVKWKRPAKGQLIKRFDRRRNDAKGIDIAGRRGDPVLASANGKVVYSGDGLISYGNLVIIKHNKTYLSAYAYNQKLLVHEGENVKAGQKIATMGNKDKGSARLHFEIRKNGKPVDPLKYIPW